MTFYFTHDLLYHLIAFQAVILVILLSNIWITHRTRHHPPYKTLPKVSIVIPARNEEKNIAKCVQSLLAQDYSDFEVLVLDDQSIDDTLVILNKIAATQPRLHVIEGKPPPANTIGKNWACSQLALQAQGELLLFTDADTLHNKNMLYETVNALLGEGADLLTGYPRQEVQTWGERLLVPFFSWVLSSFIPLGLGYRLQLPALSSAVGQFMLFRREAYLAIGGHEQIGDSVTDDLTLARRIKTARLRWRVAHISDLISCRMYRSGKEAIDGFTKNLFAAFDFRLLPFLLAFAWLLFMFWEPIIILIRMVVGQEPYAQPALIAVCLAFSFCLWLIHYIDLGIPVYLVFLYPFTILANVAIALRSCVFSLRGDLEWKGRRIARRRWTWI